jgi:hypothetical protein
LDSSTDAVDYSNAGPDLSMHGNAKIDAALEKLVGPKANWGSACPPVWDARLGANSEFLARFLERLDSTCWVAVDDHDVAPVTPDQSLDDRRYHLVTLPRFFSDD